jgi:hypothetical protein
VKALQVDSTESQSLQEHSYGNTRRTSWKAPKNCVIVRNWSSSGCLINSRNPMQLKLLLTFLDRKVGVFRELKNWSQNTTRCVEDY